MLRKLALSNVYCRSNSVPFEMTLAVPENVFIIIFKKSAFLGSKFNKDILMRLKQPIPLPLFSTSPYQKSAKALADTARCQRMPFHLADDTDVQGLPSEIRYARKITNRRHDGSRQARHPRYRSGPTSCDCRPLPGTTPSWPHPRAGRADAGSDSPIPASRARDSTTAPSDAR